REFRRRSAWRAWRCAAVEPVIGNVKAEQRIGRNHLKGRDGERINAVLAAAGYNFASPALAGEAFARPLPGARRKIAECSLGLKTGDQPFFTGDRLARGNCLSTGGPYVERRFAGHRGALVP